MVQDRPDLLTVRERPWQQATLDKVRAAGRGVSLWVGKRPWQQGALGKVRGIAHHQQSSSSSAAAGVQEWAKWPFVRYRPAGGSWRPASRQPCSCRWPGSWL